MKLQATEEEVQKNLNKSTEEDHLWVRTNIDQTLMFVIEEFHNLYHQAKRILHCHQLIVAQEESARINPSHLPFLRMVQPLWAVVYIIAIVKRISIITEVEVEARALRVVIIT